MERQAKGQLLTIESKTPVFLSERDSGGRWEVKADASVVLEVANTSGKTLVIGSTGIAQLQILLPVTKDTGKGFEDVSDLVMEKYQASITAACSAAELELKKDRSAADGYLVFYLVPKAADYQMQAGAVLQVTLEHIHAFASLESMCLVTCRYTYESVAVCVDVPVFKKKSPLVIKKFQVNGQDGGQGASGRVGIGDTVKVTWETLGAERWQLQPYARDLGQAAGSIDIQIWEEGPLCLYISQGSMGIRERFDLSLLDGQAVESFTAAPQIAAYEETVKFQWKLSNTSHAYISNGIGKVMGGSVERAPDTGSGNYVLSCIRKEAGEYILVSKPVHAGRDDVLEIVQLDFSSIPSGKEEVYSLRWMVDNCRNITLHTSDADKTEWAKGNTQGSVSFTGKNLTLELFCEGEHGQKLYLTQIRANASE